jgi:hypothetical protein
MEQEGIIGKWRPVVGYVGLYEVSADGWVRTLRFNRIMARHLTHFGYYSTALTDISGKRRDIFIHRLVIEAFLGPPPSDKHECNHKDGDKANPRLENLEWCTKSQNKLHAHRILGKCTGDSHWTKLHPEKISRGDLHYTRMHPELVARGTGHGMAKLTIEQVRMIRSLRSDGLTSKRISESLFLSRSTVEKVIYRKTWKHLI